MTTPLLSIYLLFIISFILLFRRNCSTPLAEVSSRPILTRRNRRDPHHVRRAIRSFTASELVARYELMVQYKHSTVKDCPVVWRYDGQPLENNGTLNLGHMDIHISAQNHTIPQVCSGYTNKNNNDNNENHTDATLNLLSSTFLTDTRLEHFENSIRSNVDKMTVFESIHSQLSRRVYLVSTSSLSTTEHIQQQSPFICGNSTWFQNNEMFVFFDEADTVMLSIVAKIQNGVPRILSLPLVGNIRYMISVALGTTCIYRVDTDVRQLLTDNLRTPCSPSSSPMASPSFPCPVIVNITSTTPTPQPSTSSTSSNSTVVIPTDESSPSPSLSMQSPSMSSFASSSSSATPSSSKLPSPTSLPSNTPSNSGTIEPSIQITPDIQFSFDVTTPMASSSMEEEKEKEKEVEETNEPNKNNNNNDNNNNNNSNNTNGFFGGNACFPGDSKVLLKDGRLKQMNELQEGDEVYVGNGKFSSILLFTHREKATTWEFITVTTADGRNLTASCGHYVYVQQIHQHQHHHKEPLLKIMGNINIGDILIDSSSSTTRTTVINVTRVIKKGLFNPQSLAGDIVVDGFKTSCYTSAARAPIAHALLLPIRALRKTIFSSLIKKIAVRTSERMRNWDQ